MSESKKVTNELIDFRKDFSFPHGDFSGKEYAFSAEEKIEFLQKYSDFCRKVNHLGERSVKVVEKDQIDEALRKIDYKVLPKMRKIENFSAFEATLLPKNGVYTGWQFYTKRTSLKENAIVFNDGIAPPVPCAKYEFENGENLKRIRLSVFISSEFKKEKVGLSEADMPHAITSGRVIELRSGIEEVLKIQFYAIGVVCARVGVPDPYHHKHFLLGNYRFDDWNELIIELSENSYSVEFNGQRTEDLLRTSCLAPDTLFLSGGLHPRGVWKVKPEVFEFTNTKTTDFFTAPQENNALEETLGTVDLPYVVGGFKNKDKYLILRKEFTAKKDDKQAILTFDSLDPGGKAYLNDKLIFQTDGFMRESVDVSEYLKKGKNLLTVVVEPRAPEIHYPWHRAKDTYMGWFCGVITLEYLPKAYVSGLEVVTEKVYAQSAKLLLRLKTENAAGKTVKIYLAQTNPEHGKEELIYTGLLTKGEEEISLSVRALPWSPQNPVLYSIRAEIEHTDDYVIETGFRTIEQKDGAIYLNNEKTLLRGALIMQFLPPYENIVTSHVCPTNEELVWQFLMIKSMNGNLARLHMLGYGTNDARYARFCDRLGLGLCWITRFIDSVESVQWGKGWWQGDLYVKQMQEVKEHPSILIWEGSNEYRAWGEDIDWLYDEFVSKVKAADKTRLLSPCSHLYYGGTLSGKGYYYQDDGEFDQDFQPVKASFGWKDDLVIRSAHPYCITLGYGGSWEAFRKQPWDAQPSLFESKKHAYLVTEMAVIGRHDDTTPEAQIYVKNDSYELPGGERLFGRPLEQSEWRISQAYQALCAAKAIQLLRVKGVDGLSWCCLSGGANDASYLKPPIDFYGYAKYAFFAMKENYAETIAFNESTDLRYGKNSALKPCIVGAKPNEKYDLNVSIYDENDCLIDEKTYTDICGEGKITLGEWKPNWQEEGTYRICYELNVR